MEKRKKTSLKSEEEQLKRKVLSSLLKIPEIGYTRKERIEKALKKGAKLDVRKRCYTCGVNRQVKFFHRQKSTPDGLHYECKACVAYRKHKKRKGNE